jgi:glucosamine 6-phosphate synthetase-like amidotransferase/phosphosugar isomerase protein
MTRNLDNNDKVRRRSAIISGHIRPQSSSHVQQSNTNHMLAHAPTCGIIAFVSKEEPAFTYLMEGLTILQNRGYDSAGICTLTRTSQTEHQLTVSKFASLNTTSDALQRLQTSQPEHSKNLLGMAHTRWATHGGKTDRNAHPHVDHHNRIAIVHNGVIENATEIKKRLQSPPHSVTFRSETDTEVIVQLLSVNLAQEERNSQSKDHQEHLLTALRHTLKELLAKICQIVYWQCVTEVH